MNMRRAMLFALLLPVTLLTAGGCAVWPETASRAVDDCIMAAAGRLREAPEWVCLPTLDGQCVGLATIFAQCARRWPDCVLYDKFYLWESEVKTITSRSTQGPVSHQVRIYHSILYTCDPAATDPGRTHGDVAEFYDPAGRFMGLAVYMGQGLYCPLPHWNYVPPDFQ